MAPPRHFKPADFGADLADLPYKRATITWRRPEVWIPNEKPPTGIDNFEPGYLYAIVRNHHRANTKDTISYIGITNNLDRRFNCHPKAKEFSEMRGSTSLSIGEIDYHGYRTAERDGNRKALEGLEHIIIWALWPTLYNEKKQYSLPRFSAPISQAWQISNDGYRFSGRMPREIVYPWMLIKPGRDRSAKT